MHPLLEEGPKYSAFCTTAGPERRSTCFPTTNKLSQCLRFLPKLQVRSSACLTEMQQGMIPACTECIGRQSARIPQALANWFSLRHQHLMAQSDELLCTGTARQAFKASKLTSQPDVLTHSDSLTNSDEPQQPPGYTVNVSVSVTAEGGPHSPSVPAPSTFLRVDPGGINRCTNCASTWVS